MPKYWLSIFFGYNGGPYNGMQHQKQQHVNSVQNQLIPLLFKAGFLPTDNYTDLQRKHKYSRAARTDKGVHALMNAISCQMILDKKYLDQDSQLIKNKLHQDLLQLFEQTNLVFHCAKRVTTRFEMRQMIQSRRYSYICPLSMFQSSSLTREQTLQKINLTCKQYVGTHNFHNYSRDLKAKDAQAQRYILTFTAQLFGHEGQSQEDKKFVKFQIHGQSFVYNQIRKMIGGIIFVFVNDYVPEFIANTFFRNQFYLPTAPAEGLYLKGIDFRGYNMKKQIPQKIQFEQEHIIKSTKILEKQIQQFILNTDKQVWDNWYDQIKSGKIVIPFYQDFGQPQKGEAA